MRQAWIVGGFFVGGCLVGAVMTIDILYQAASPLDFSPLERAQLQSLPYRVLFPTYLPEKAERKVFQFDQPDGGQDIRFVVAYASPQGCFGLVEGAGVPVVKGDDPLLIHHPALGQTTLFTRPALGSTPFSGKKVVVAALVGPEQLPVPLDCPRPLEAAEAERVLRGLHAMDPPPPPLPPLR